MYLSSNVSRIAEDVYAFAHDEIVPVALDLAGEVAHSVRVL